MNKKCPDCKQYKPQDTFLRILGKDVPRMKRQGKTVCKTCARKYEGQNGVSIITA